MKKLKFEMKIILAVFLLSITVSCSSDEDILDEAIISEEQNDIASSDGKALIGCNLVNASLGPNASRLQSCRDKSNPINTGLLDCRATRGGYGERSGFGTYSIYGGATNDTKRSVRVERGFKNFSRANSKYMVFNATFKISHLSGAHTYIAQTHGSKNVVVGPSCAIGKKHTSAMYLLRVERNPNNPNKYNVFREDSTKPYVQGGTGDCKRGRRSKTFLRTINKNQEYSLIVRSGYNSSGNSYTYIKIGDKSFFKFHAFTTEEMYFRYGAYNAKKTGSDADRFSKIHFKNTSYCVHKD